MAFALVVRAMVSNKTHTLFRTTRSIYKWPKIFLDRNSIEFSSLHLAISFHFDHTMRLSTILFAALAAIDEAAALAREEEHSKYK